MTAFGVVCRSVMLRESDTCWPRGKEGQKIGLSAWDCHIGLGLPLLLGGSLPSNRAARVWPKAHEPRRRHAQGRTGSAADAPAARGPSARALKRSRCRLCSGCGRLEQRGTGLRHRPQIKVGVNHLVGHTKGPLLGALNQPNLHQGVHVLMHALDVSLERSCQPPHARGP